jgi:exodeoxyribonuclease V alpha subunit
MIQETDKYFAQFFPDKNIRPFALLLAQKMREGHVCIPVTDMPEPTELGEVSLTSLQKVDPRFLSDTDARVPFIFNKPYLYLQRYYRYETQVIEWIRARLQSSIVKKEIFKSQVNSCRELIIDQAATYSLDGLANEEKTDWQLIAVIRSLLNEFSIITGGPGTGKTTTLSKLLLILYSLDINSTIALAAPTGKASMRMLESLRDKSSKFPAPIIEKIEALKPYTLHRLLGYQRNSVYFRHNQENPLPYEWVIVDEASMIDLPMFAKLLSACGPSTRLLLLGDKDQLASVEAGSLFGDLCLAAGELNRFSSEDAEWLNGFVSNESRQITTALRSDNIVPLASCITELRLSHRFKQQGEVGQLSKAIIRADEAEAVRLLAEENSKKIQIIDHNNEEFFNDFIGDYVDFLQEPDVAKALKKLNLLRVLVTVREGDCGLYSINRKIEKVLHTLHPELIRPVAGFYHNRPIIITKNNYELDLFNGDIGLVRNDPQTNQLRVWFEDTEGKAALRSVSPASLSDSETVFAMTIHKSQGSEFKKVMVVLPDTAENPLLTRELLYTGITRAIESVIIRGSLECLRAGVQKRVQRQSGIQTRIHLKQ